ncbi:MAG: hypothetical protein AB1921_16270 [Thermodesulfobacteriota bacterium]
MLRTREDRSSRPSDDKKLADLVNMGDPLAVLAEVEQIVALMDKAIDMGFVRAVFVDIQALFAGEFPGYQGCNTGFHDHSHTMDCFLAMARLIHGGRVSGIPLTEREITMGLVTALMHDTGYIQLSDETEGTGGSYTMVHVQRSIDFMDRYFKDRSITFEDYELARRCVKCTGLDVHINEIRFESDRHAVLGKMLGTSDLLGQMASRTYLEKLLFLYQEFTEAGIPGFSDEEDLLRKTGNFYQITLKRLAKELSGVNRYMQPHFAARFGIDKDLYAEAVVRNINYLSHIMEDHPGDYRRRLRRGGFVKP